jgi:Protein of unknown function (DUF3892)
MTVFVTAVHMGGGNDHQHIAQIRWLDCGNSTSQTMNLANAIAWLEKGNQLLVADGDGPAAVQVVHAKPPYIRTAANGQWTDNLLALPRY